MKNLERRTLAFELRKASQDGSEFSGIASTFYKIDDYGSMFDRGAFDDTITFFLTRGFIGGLDHNWSQPIGKPKAASTDNVGLLVDARISNTAHGRDMKELIKDEVISQLSIGFLTLGYEWLNTQEDVEQYWEKHGYTPDAEDLVRCRYGALLKTKVKLYEVSPVTVPANTDCLITDVRSSNGEPTSETINRVLVANEQLLERLRGEPREELRQSLGRLRALLDGIEETPANATSADTPAEGLSIQRRCMADVAALEYEFLKMGGRL